jgi:hypothetical protein
LTDWRPPGPRDFKCDYSPDGTAVHIRPRNDLIWHTADDDCPCGPDSTNIDLSDDGPYAYARWIVVHHALDGRGRPQGGYTPGEPPAAGPGTEVPA